MFSLFLDENISSLSTFCPVVLKAAGPGGERRVMWTNRMSPE
jgi:hypothetical protein